MTYDWMDLLGILSKHFYYLSFTFIFFSFYLLDSNRVWTWDDTIISLNDINIISTMLAQQISLCPEFNESLKSRLPDDTFFFSNFNYQPFSL